MGNDQLFLKRAVEIAGNGISEGCGPFGAVITKDQKIIAEANNRVVLSHDPTAHAEIIAIRKASAVLKTHNLSGCVIYSSCEPCPMCLGAVYWSGMKKVVYASDRSEAAASGFSDSVIYDEIILNPEERNITFRHIPDAGGERVFKLWDDYENKVPY
jgi:guanine deaminase